MDAGAGTDDRQRLRERGAIAARGAPFACARRLTRWPAMRITSSPDEIAVTAAAADALRDRANLAETEG